MNIFGWGRYVACSCLLFSILLVSPLALHAAEVCAEKGEFVHFLKQHKLYTERDKVQSALIVELKAHIADLEEGRKIDQRYREAAEPLIEELTAQRMQIMKENAALREEIDNKKKLEWMEQAEIIGSTVVVTLATRYGVGKAFKWGKALMGR